MSEIRYDALHDTHVIIAPERLHRPDSMKERVGDVHLSPCPFCEGNEELTPKEIFAIRPGGFNANQIGWKTRVVPNLYKALAIETPHRTHHDPYEHWDGFGAHEVIIDTSRHTTSMVQWEEDDFVFWLKTIRQRVEDLRRDGRLRYMSVFKNEGGDSGSTMEHCHTQLIALPLIPKEVHSLHQRSVDYYRTHQHSLMESIIDKEEYSQSRMVIQKGVFSAFCPYASGYPFEMMVSSKTYVGQIDTIDDHHLRDLASLLKTMIGLLNDQVPNLSFNLTVSTPVLGEEMSVMEAHRLVVRIMPRIYRLGGFEVSTQMLINPLSPELAAKILRGEEYGS